MAGYYDQEEVLRELQDGDGNYEYYALLNVGQNADQDEIRRSYHRLCRIYHPDRYQDERKQRTATEFFRRIQEAYKVLSDPRTRSIYDKRGLVGLSEDVAIIERSSLPSELMEEYEKLRELWEERSFIQKCMPTGNFRMDVDATSLIDENYGFKSRSVSIEKISMDQSVDAAITKSSIGQVSGILSAPSNGKLFGVLRFSLMHFYTNQNWIKGSVLFGSTPGLGFEGYHVINDAMYLTGQSTFAMTQEGHVRLGASTSVHRRLSDSTTGTITIYDLGNATTVKLTHQISATCSASAEATVREADSHVKGALTYQPIPHYLLKAGVKAGTKGVNVSYGIEHDVDKITTIGSTVHVGPSQGVVLSLKLTRASMSFSAKIKLSDFVGVAALFYATSLPLVIYGCVRSVAILPMLRKEWEKEIKVKKSEKAKEVLEKKKTAEAAVELMQETVERVVNTEQAKHGLLIVEAWYGKLFDHQAVDDAIHNMIQEPKVIDVRIPLQCMVADSKLILRETSKAIIPGFYDPCIGERKFLRVKYEFRGVPHEVTVKNSEPLIIPRMSHKLIVHTEP